MVVQCNGRQATRINKGKIGISTSPSSNALMSIERESWEEDSSNHFDSCTNREQIWGVKCEGQYDGIAICSDDSGGLLGDGLNVACAGSKEDGRATLNGAANIGDEIQLCVSHEPLTADLRPLGGQAMIHG